ncbi:hypothetical protein KI387_038777 [Taxus chinensis]|uniref:Senescence domain-containing protein n=1 Tax=Taxus chinensis TaxID=29808 RepID=A0AA38CCL1_TAXCH|nr:hypothetical protein KI387_038777 [Taxus chinensis]
MGGECSMTTVESGLEGICTGSENELLRIKGAELCLIDRKESVIMIQSGDFSFNVIKQTHSPLAAVVGLVGDLQWPVGRDSPSMKVGNKKYAFALPGEILYGLLLPGDTPLEAEQSLEGLLHHYSMFESHPEVSQGEQGWLVQAKQETAAYWTAVAPQLDKISVNAVQKLHAESTSATSLATWTDSGLCWMGPAVTSRQDVTDDKPTSPPGLAVNDDDGVSPRMRNRIQRARRLSAVAKLLSKTLLRGAINVNRHVAGQITDSSPVQSSPPTADIILASVDAFAKVVEAVETAGRSLFELADLQQHHKLQEQERRQSGAACPEGLWTLNKSGLRLLLRATALSAVIHVARGVGTTSSLSPAQSSPQSVLSQQPSDTPSEDNSCAINFMSADSVFSSRPPTAVTRVQHLPNSPFQHYSKSGSADSHFHFSLGLDTTDADPQP